MGPHKMAVSKRLRFEILRRDNHQCRYCGATAPKVHLTVDHVVPVALGGNDEPSNLVAACSDCNAGKSSVPADADRVADVAADALRWARAMEQAAAISRRQRDDDEEFCTAFVCQMLADAEAEPSYICPDPPGSQQDVDRTIVQFRDNGLDLDDLRFAVNRAMANRKLSSRHVWRYFCGICWRMISDRQEAARALIETEDADG